MADIAKITLKGESEDKNFIDEALRGDIAYEELSTTVSKTGGYVAGDHLIYLGQYYEVVADIAQGGTIVTSGAGQNVEEREVGDEIKKNKTQVLGVICDVETSPATAAHSAGDQFYYDGALVEATSAIAIGDTIVVSPDTGYNVKVADKVVAQIQTLTNNVDVLIENGAINLLPIKCPNQTENNVTLTNNNDGSVTISGTASANTYFYLLENSRSHLEIIEGTGKSYTLSGCTSGSGSTYALRMLGSTDLVNWYTVGQIQTTEEMTFTEGAYPYYAVRLDVFSGTSVNVTIKPMLVDSKYKGTYQPYAKTNKELTDDVADKLLIKTALSQKVSVTADGTKTLQTLLNELHSALASIISSLGNNEILKVIDCQLDDGSHLIPFRSDYIYTKASTLGNMQFSSFQITIGQNVYIRSVMISGTLVNNTYLQMKISPSATEYSARESEIPTSDSKVFVFYQILEKIS
jgi:hypothetical protein